LAAIMLAGFALPASAGEAASQIWLVSTRSAPHDGIPLPGPSCLDYWRLAGKGGQSSFAGTAQRVLRTNGDCPPFPADGESEWSPADAKTFHSSDDPAVPTVVFIHGNRNDADEAVETGWCTYQSIRSQTDRPLRYVIWSWPADREFRRNRPDARLKAAWSDVDAWYLAQWLAEFRPGVRVSLIGHSFGPRIITGALHLLAGGQLAGCGLPEKAVAAWSTGKRNPIRAVLLAAALDYDWLAPGGCHERALLLVDQVLVTCNPCDRALRWYSRMDGRGGPPALGSVGPCGVENAKNLELINVSATVGRLHDYREYNAAPDVSSRWARYTFGEELPLPSAL
jgi:esterase/lipase superfamily enzyme